MKDRLIELLKKTPHGTYTLENVIEPLYIENVMAKYLLENGVVVPPYKIGTKVYVPINSLILPIPNAVYECEIQRYGLVTGGLVPIVKLKKGSITYGDIQTSLDKLFSSREEAEAKLKEGGE